MHILKNLVDLTDLTKKLHFPFRLELKEPHFGSSQAKIHGAALEVIMEANTEMTSDAHRKSLLGVFANGQPLNGLPAKVAAKT